MNTAMETGKVVHEGRRRDGTVTIRRKDGPSIVLDTVVFVEAVRELFG